MIHYCHLAVEDLWTTVQQKLKTPCGAVQQIDQRTLLIGHIDQWMLLIGQIGQQTWLIG